MTGSKSIVNLLNRFGHSIRNEKVRRIDIGMESSLTSSNSLVSNQIIKTPELYTSLAWEKFDVNLETLSGADSVHHTYRICYQNVSSTIQVPQKITETTCKKRKIKDITSVLKEAREMELPPCRKKPEMSYLEFTKIKMTKLESLQITKHLDFTWMTSFNLLENTPMWTGWNTEQFIEEYSRQRVEYMQDIPFPPTRTDVVKETIVQSKRVSQECGSTFAIITYDLAIAKIAKKIQNEEPDEFKDVFIMFGAFHIEGSIFSAIGKLIEGSGGPYLLIESGVIASGSMNRFLKGKMYNGCRRGHIILSTAMGYISSLF